MLGFVLILALAVDSGATPQSQWPETSSGSRGAPVFSAARTQGSIATSSFRSDCLQGLDHANVGRPLTGRSELRRRLAGGPTNRVGGAFGLDPQAEGAKPVSLDASRGNLCTEERSVFIDLVEGPRDDAEIKGTVSLRARVTATPPLRNIQIDAEADPAYDSENTFKRSLAAQDWSAAEDRRDVTIPATWPTQDVNVSNGVYRIIIEVTFWNNNRALQVVDGLKVNNQPQDPLGVSAVLRGNSVELTWKKNPERDVRHYRIDRSQGDGPFEKIYPPGDRSALLDLPDDPKMVRAEGDRFWFTDQPPAGADVRYKVTAIRRSPVGEKVILSRPSQESQRVRVAGAKSLAPVTCPGGPCESPDPNPVTGSPDGSAPGQPGQAGQAGQAGQQQQGQGPNLSPPSNGSESLKPNKQQPSGMPNPSTMSPVPSSPASESPSPGESAVKARGTDSNTSSGTMLFTLLAVSVACVVISSTFAVRRMKRRRF